MNSVAPNTPIFLRNKKKKLHAQILLFLKVKQSKKFRKLTPTNGDGGRFKFVCKHQKAVIKEIIKKNYIKMKSWLFHEPLNILILKDRFIQKFRHPNYIVQGRKHRFTIYFEHFCLRDYMQKRIQIYLFIFCDDFFVWLNTYAHRKKLTSILRIKWNSCFNFSVIFQI